MSIKNIIYIENGKVSVIRYKNDKLEFIKRDGEKEFIISDEFWCWWKNAVSYLKENKLDICFIYDNNNDIISNEFYNSADKVDGKNTMWNIDYIRQFFAKVKEDYRDVCLIDINENKVYLKETTEKKHPHVYYTNLELDNFTNEVEQEIEDETVKEQELIKDEEIGTVAKYFLELMKEEKGQ